MSYNRLSEMVSRVIFLIAIIVICADLFIWRAG